MFDATAVGRDVLRTVYKLHRLNLLGDIVVRQQVLKSLLGSIVVLTVCCSALYAQDATTAPFYPLDCASNADGDLFVVDRNLPGVWKITDGKAEVFFQGPKQFRQPLNAPRCIAIDEAGRVFVGDSAARNVFLIAEGQEPHPICSERIGIPMSIAVDSDGQVIVADLELHRILRLPRFEGAVVAPEVLAEIRAPRALTVDAEGDVWVVSGTAKAIRKVKPSGDIEVIVEQSSLKYPAGIAVLDGDVVVSDSYGKSVSKVGADGTVTGLAAGDSLVYPVHLSANADGVLIADSRGGAIRQIKADGTVTTLFEGNKGE